MINEIIHGDCLVESEQIESGSVDLILTDLPYGNMDTDGGRKLGINGWDMPIEPDKVYEIANRILRKNGKMVLFSQEPYTSELKNRAIPNVPFCYRMVWEKDSFANALGCNKAPVSYYEDILVFSKNECYQAKHPLREVMRKYAVKYGEDYLVHLFSREGRYTSDMSARVHASYKFGFNGGARFDLMNKSLYAYLSNHIEFKETFEQLSEVDNEYKEKYASTFNLWEGKKYKSNILKYKKDYDGYHPTQKPVLLLEDLIKTYSNRCDLVIDLTCGSGSTAIACLNTGRNFIGIEKDEHYHKIACERVQKWHDEQGLADKKV